MTLKACCSKIRAILKRQAWLAALWFVVLFFAQPVYTALLISDRRWNADYHLRLAGDLLQVFGQQSFVLTWCLMIMAFISALVFGGYMHRQRQVDFYHSQPQPRNTLLLQHGAAGLLSLLIPYIASLLLTVVVALAMGAAPYFPWLGLLTGFCTHTLFFTAIFLTSLIAVTISGNGAVAMLTGLFLLGVGPALLGLWLMIMDKFYPVFYESLYRWDMIVRWLSPAAAYACLPINGMPHTVFPIIIFDALAGLGLLAIYRRRKSEMAGQAIAFKPVKAPLKYALALVAATIMALIFNSIGDNNSGYFWWYFGAVAGAFLATQITEIVYAFDFRAILRHLRGLGIFLLVYLALSTGAIHDVTGFNRALPQTEEVTSAEVYLPGVSNYMMMGGGYYYGNSYRDPGSEIRLLEMSERDLLAMGPVTDPQAIAALVRMASLYALGQTEEQVVALKAGGKEYLFEYGQANSSYINSYPAQTNMRVVFTLKNGSTFAREYQYNRPVQFLMEDLRIIYGQTDFRAAQLTRLNHADDHYLPEYLQIFELYYPPSPLPQFSMAERSRLLAALRADMLELTVAEQEQTEPIGALNLRMYGGAVDYSEMNEENRRFYRPYTTLRLAIYPSFSRTLSFLADYDYSAKLWQPQLGAIQSVKLYDQTVNYGGDRDYYSYEVTMPMAISSYAIYGKSQLAPDAQNVTEVTDPAEIAEIIANTYPSEATEYNSFIDIDRRMEAEVWYVGADGQSYITRRVFSF